MMAAEQGIDAPASRLTRPMKRPPTQHVPIAVVLFEDRRLLRQEERNYRKGMIQGCREEEGKRMIKKTIHVFCLVYFGGCNEIP